MVSVNCVHYDKLLEGPLGRVTEKIQKGEEGV